jgi:hypothetical protein
VDTSVIHEVNRDTLTANCGDTLDRDEQVKE